MEWKERERNRERLETGRGVKRQSLAGKNKEEEGTKKDKII
jgi:hypothetical protein